MLKNSDFNWQLEISPASNVVQSSDPISSCLLLLKPFTAYYSLSKSLLLEYSKNLGHHHRHPPRTVHMKPNLVVTNFLFYTVVIVPPRNSCYVFFNSCLVLLSTPFKLNVLLAAAKFLLAAPHIISV